MAWTIPEPREPQRARERRGPEHHDRPRCAARDERPDILEQVLQKVDDRAVACLELMLDAPKKMANAIMRERVKGGKERDARQE